MYTYNIGEKAIQYNDVTQGDFVDVVAGILAGETLIVKQVNDVDVLAVATFFEKTKMSFSKLAGKTEFSKERIIVAINSFITSHQDDICELDLSQIKCLKVALIGLQSSFAKEPSLIAGKSAYLRDYSKNEAAASQEYQRYILAEATLKPSIEATEAAISSFESIYVTDSAIEEDLLIVHNTLVVHEEAKKDSDSLYDDQELLEQGYKLRAIFARDAIQSRETGEGSF